MSSKTSKHTRARSRRAHKTTERAPTEKQVREAQERLRKTIDRESARVLRLKEAHAAHRGEAGKSSKLEQAEAIIACHEQGAHRIEIENPFYQGSGVQDTIHAVACGLGALAHGDFKESQLSADTGYGLHLLLECMRCALQAGYEQAGEQMKAQKARGVVEALKP